MAIFQLGSIIRNRREELGFSQEDLADGICSVPTLSRIENGERMPTKNHFEMLMQRLGYSAMSLDYFTDKQDFLCYEMKFKIRQAYVVKNYTLAKAYLNDLESNLKKPTKMDRQFVILYKILLNEDSYTNIDKLKQMEEAILLTCPRYKKFNIPMVLSYDEIILLNNIAICYDVEGDQRTVITILTALKEYYDHHVISEEEALRTQPMILYNLSKYLGLYGQYDECIEICDIGIRIARKTGRCAQLAKTLYNRGWALLRRNQTGDYEAAKESFKQAYHIADAMGKIQDKVFINKVYKTTFGKSISE